jgi:hypothetical protein
MIIGCLSFGCDSIRIRKKPGESIAMLSPSFLANSSSSIRVSSDISITSIIAPIGREKSFFQQKFCLKLKPLIKKKRGD